MTARHEPQRPGPRRQREADVVTGEGVAPHETAAFCHAVTYRVTITYTVAGGARRGTAERRARRVAARLADAAARAAGVVEVTARAGPARDDGGTSASRPVAFTAANIDPAPGPGRGLLLRYTDPDHERARRSLAAATAAQQQRQQADRQRREAAGCADPDRLRGDVWCGCVYCQPGQHLHVLVEHERAGPCALIDYRCVCGQPVAAAGERCLAHRGVRIVALDGDDPALCELVDADHDRRVSGAPQGGEAPSRDRAPDASHGCGHRSERGGLDGVNGEREHDL